MGAAREAAISSPALYDDDILLWSEEQAEVIRRLGKTRGDLPNEFDVENVAEEIESVGRSELASVKSQIRLILSHLIKIYCEPYSLSRRHWEGELIVFHAELADRYAASMRQRIDLHRLWSTVREQAYAASDAAQNAAAPLPESTPFALDDLLQDHLQIETLVGRLGALRKTSKE